MIVEMVQQVRSMGQGYTNTYLIPIRNYLELAPKCIVPIEDNQAMVDSTTSDKELSKDQAEGLGGEILYRNPHLTFCITGKLVIGQWKGHNSKVHIVRSPTSVCNRKLQFPYLDSVKLVIFGSATEDGKVLLLEKESSETWKQSSLAEL